MKHLSDEAVVDVAEGGTVGLEHLDSCSVCRERVRSMRHMMKLLQEDPVPEPSPLFWEHLSDRIRKAAVEETTPSAMEGLRALGERLWAVCRASARKPQVDRLLTMPRWSWGLAAVASIIIAVFVLSPARAPDTVADRSSAGSSLQPGQGSVVTADELGWAAMAADESWQIVEGAAVDLDLEAAVDAGIFLREGSLDRELLMLSDQDRHDLARAIQTELDRARS